MIRVDKIRRVDSGQPAFAGLNEQKKFVRRRIRLLKFNSGDSLKELIRDLGGIAVAVVDIVTDDGTVIGKLDLETMRTLAPNYELEDHLARDGSIFFIRNGIRTILSPDDGKQKKRQ